MRHAKRRKNKAAAFSFTLMDELMASPHSPVPAFRIESHLRRVRSGLDALMKDDIPALEAWRNLSDAVNILSAAAELGIVTDETGECDKAAVAMGEAGDKLQSSGALRLTGEGTRCLLDFLDDYGEVAAAMTERDFIRCCRHAERRNREILAGKSRPGDKVVAL